MSEIGNKALLRGVADRLNIVDVERAPSELDTSSVKMVVGLDQGGWPGRQIERGSVANFPVAGLTTWTQPIAGLNRAAFQTLLSSNNSRGPLFDMRIMALSWQIDFDGAGAPAFAGQTIAAEVQYTVQDGLSYVGHVVRLRPWITGAAAVFNYHFALGAFRDVQSTPGMQCAPWQGYLPAELGLRVEFFASAALPANTVMHAWAIGLKQPNGQQLPL